jgi:hypothetical protein
MNTIDLRPRCHHHGRRAWHRLCGCPDKRPCGALGRRRRSSESRGTAFRAWRCFHSSSTFPTRLVSKSLPRLPSPDMASWTCSSIITPVSRADTSDYGSSPHGLAARDRDQLDRALISTAGPQCRRCSKAAGGASSTSHRVGVRKAVQRLALFLVKKGEPHDPRSHRARSTPRRTSSSTARRPRAIAYPRRRSSLLAKLLPTKTGKALQV